MVQVPAVTKVSAPPLVIVQTPVVVLLKVGVRPLSEVAVSVGVVPKVCVPGLLKVMVCVERGVTDVEAAEAPEVPPTLVAVLVKVYACPLVRPVTAQEPLAPVTVHCAPPGLAVTV